MSGWFCKECGHKEIKWVGSCAQCKSWNSFVEERASKKKSEFLSKIVQSEFSRLKTELEGFDRLLGGGVVPGSLLLLGGEPGIGKSTLLLQLSDAFMKKGKVLYVSGEESLDQISLRAKRLGLKGDLLLMNETDYLAVEEEIRAVKPHLVVIDSIQVMKNRDILSSSGSVTQVRELASSFMQLAKELGVTIILVGHVTKSGDIAGPKVLEHLVDVVLEFEGREKEGLRLLRSTKNRYGPTEEVIFFQMRDDGLKEIKDPSNLFLEERVFNAPGSVITAAVEGSQLVLVEVQALVAPSYFSNPTRRCTGCDSNRLALLLAVLEKKVGLNLSGMDVFVSIAGGIRVFDPALDLGIVLAVASSFTSKAINHDTFVFGEVGLAGEVRAVPYSEMRVREAFKRGFKTCLLPKKAKVSSEIKVELISIEFVNEAIRRLL